MADFFIKENSSRNYFNWCIGKHDNTVFWSKYYRSKLFNDQKHSIVKTDTDLNILWSKEFNFIGDFIDCITIGSDTYFVGTHKDETASPVPPNFCVLKCDNNGNVIWYKSFTIYGGLDQTHVIAKKIDSDKIVIAYGRTVCILNINGEIISKSRITFPDLKSFAIGNLEIYNNEIILLSTNTTSSIGAFYIVKLNIDLDVTLSSNVKYDLPISDFGGSGVSYSKIVEDKLLFAFAPFLKSNGEQLAVNTKAIISIDLNNLSSKGVHFLKHEPNNRNYLQMEEENSAFYFSDVSPSRENGVIHKLDKDLTVLWSKEIVGNTYFGDNLTVYNNFIYIHEGSGNVIKIDINLTTNSCLEIVDIPNLILNEFTCSLENFSIVSDKESASLFVSNLDQNFTEISINYEQICPVIEISPSIDKSTITASPNTIDANGASTSTITVQLKDETGANINSDTQNVQITTTKGVLSSVSFNTNGTYTATLTSTTSHELARLSFTVNGDSASKKAYVRFKGNLPIAPNCDKPFAFAGFKNNLILRIKKYNDSLYVLTESGVVSKINADRKLLWSSEENFLEEENFSFPDFSEIEVDNSGNLIVFKVYRSGEGIIEKFSSQGISLWTKSLAITGVDILASRTPFLLNLYSEEFILVFNNTILKFDASGTVLKSISYQVQSDHSFDIYLNNVTTSKDYIVINSRGFISVFNHDLEIVNSIHLVSFHHTSQENITIKEDDLLVASENYGYFKIPILDSLNSVQAKKYTFTSTNSLSSRVRNTIPGYYIPQRTGVKSNQRFIYAFSESERNDMLGGFPIVHKLDTDFNIIWSKQIEQLITDPELKLYSGLDNPILPGEIFSFDVNGSCLSMSLTSIYDESFFTNGWVVNTDEDLNVDAGNCLKIVNVASPTYTEQTVELTNFENVITAVETIVTDTQSSTVAFDEIIYPEICPAIELPKIRHAQSPFIHLQAAGSTGNDGSLAGIHLRWIFKHELGENHLAKGNLATTTNNFNKPDDFVKIYKAPYEKIEVEIDFNTVPLLFDEVDKAGGNKYWIYHIDGSRFKILFRNNTKYNSVRNSYNPSIAPLNFIRAYGNDLIEIQSEYSAFFGVEFNLQNTTPNSTLQTEYIGEEDNLLISKKGIIARKTFSGSELPNPSINAEDLKIIRLKANNCTLKKIKVELYAHFVKKTNEENLWTEIGQYALTTNNSAAFSNLEATPNSIHGKWPRFNNGDFVNIENYKDKWATVKEDPTFKNIKQTVEEYLTLSDNANNPKASTKILFEDEGLEQSFEVDYLDVLHILSMDFHIARMLGLGTIDEEPANTTNKFVYKIEYGTNKRLKSYNYDENSTDFEILHEYISMPTSINDERLPIPYELERIVPGVPVNSQLNPTTENGMLTNNPLLDASGYSNSGKSRFVSIYAKELKDQEYSNTFYASNERFNTTEATAPVNGSIEYKEIPLNGNTAPLSGWKPTANDSWQRPELSSSDEYINIVTQGEPTAEAVPLGIPEEGFPLYVHRQTEDAYYIYSTYGINWFSRVSPSPKTLEIKTEFIPENTLLAPDNVNALNIVEERPLLLTSREEQFLAKALRDGNKDDKTLVRLTFDYNTTQELVSYKVTQEAETLAIQKYKDEAPINSDVLLYEKSIFKDEREVFANEVEVFFRNKVPQNIRGKVIRVQDHPTNPKLSIVFTGKYLLNSATTPNSTEENKKYIVPKIPTGVSASSFVGGVLALNGTNFYIQNIVDSVLGPVITVYKKEGQGVFSKGIEPVGLDKLESPVIESDALFMAIENMSGASSWGVPNPNNSFKIKIGVNGSHLIHREILERKGPDTEPEKVLEKTRGFWGSTTISKVEEPIRIVPSGDDQVIESAHKGTYKIEFPYKLDNHPQNIPDAKGNFVNWSGGILRARVDDPENPNGPRRVLRVVKLINVGSATDNLIVYAQDDGFQLGVETDTNGVEVIDPNTGEPIPKPIPPEHTIFEGDNIEVNFYPGYKAYLYADPSSGLTQTNISPTEDEEVKYSIFGLRVVDLESVEKYGQLYRSQISPPAIMFAHQFIDALKPEPSEGAFYATRPDSYGKSTYTLKTRFRHNPYGIIYYRGNDHLILNTIYEPETVKGILEKLEELAPDYYFANRWNNLLGFDYSNYTSTFDENGEFEKLPKTASGYRFPLPDRKALFDSINKDINFYNRKFNLRIQNVRAGETKLNTVLVPHIPFVTNAKAFSDFLKDAILNSFAPLTEVPLIYRYIKGGNYQPIARKQVIKNKYGELLSPRDSAYEIAPMARKSGNRKVLFTDFTLDGTSKNTYFYAVREMGTGSQLGEFSDVKGPIKLVNTNAPEAPVIKSIMPVLGTNTIVKKEIPLTFTDIQNVTITANRLTKSRVSQNWDAGLASKQILASNGIVKFKINPNSECIIGFSPYNQNANFETVKYGLYCKPNGIFEIYKNNTKVKSLDTQSFESVFSIEIKGPNILFYVDENLLYSLLREEKENLLLDVSLKSSNTSITDLQLFTSTNYFEDELYEGEEIPLTFSNPEEITIVGNTISKNGSALGDKWDAAAYSNEYIPLYGTITFKVLQNKRVIVGLATLNNQNSDNSSVKYGIITNEDGTLQVANNGIPIADSVNYDENSVLAIELRDNVLLYKKDQRTFFAQKLDNNIPLIVDFSLFTGDSKIINLQLFKTIKVKPNYRFQIDDFPVFNFDINAYPKDQNISKLKLYRTRFPEKSLSVRDMDLVSTVDLVLTNQLNNNSWQIKDTFSDLENIPYSEPVFYRITAQKRVEYAKPRKRNSDQNLIVITEEKPSTPSKLLISTMVESNVPEAPTLTYGADFSENNTTIADNVVLRWNKTVHNGKYYVFKMNSQGNWVKIHEIKTNEDNIQLLLEETDLEIGVLQIVDIEEQNVYHHFKIEAENSVGMLSTEYKLLTITSTEGLAVSEGIGSMIVENTNLIR